MRSSARGFSGRLAFSRSIQNPQQRSSRGLVEDRRPVRIELDLDCRVPKARTGPI